MKLGWTVIGWEDYLYWQANDFSKVKRINELIKDIQRSPFQGIGKPEPLKFNLTGYWSRKINAEHRLVYEVKGSKEIKNGKVIDNREIVIIQCRYYY